MTKLKGGINNSNFYINKFFAFDRGRKVNQYIPMFKDKSLAKGNPLSKLTEAKSIISDWGDRLNFYKRTKRKGQIYFMLKKYGMI